MRNRMSRSRIRTGPCWKWAGLVLLVLSAGCGRSTGTVSGKVTFEDQPLGFGTIALICQDGSVSSGMIRDGTYTIPEVPVGPVEITVRAYPPPRPTMTPPGETRAAAQPPQSEFVPIPERYSDHDQSGLAYTVVPGAQTHDLALEP